MSRIVKVSQSDYRVVVQPEGTITLDVGISPGKVVITGDLIVQGEQTTVNTTTLDIEDNVITLNKGETSASGITEETSGIRIDRGQTYRESIGDLTPSPYDALIEFDENISHWDPLLGTNVDGTFVLRTADGKLTGLELSTLKTSNASDLTFDLSNTSRMLKIVNTTDYSSRVTDPNHIPNRAWVQDYISSGIIIEGQADVDRIYKGHGLPVVVDTEILATPFSLLFYVGGTDTINQRAQITSSGLSVDNVNLFGNDITNISSNNLKLTANNYNIEVDAVLNLDDIDGKVSPPSATGGKTKIYSQTTAGPGRSGIFFTNNTPYGNNAYSSDELVAKNRALLFSMLF